MFIMTDKTTFIITHGAIIAIIIAFGDLCCMAQRNVVVMDVETNVPLRDVQVFVNSTEGDRIVTDYKGELTIPDTATSITLCHPKYEKRIMNKDEFADTLMMLPNYNRLNEVVVKGKMPRISPFIMASVQDAAISAPKKAGVSFNFFDLFTWKKRKKQRERMKAIEDY